MWTSIVLGGGWLWWKRPSRPLDFSTTPKGVDQASVEQALKNAEAWLARWQTESPDNTVSLDDYTTQLEVLRMAMERTQVSIAILGGKGTGKTELVQQLTQRWWAQETPQATVQEIFEMDGSGAEIGDRPAATLTSADLLIFLVAGDLTDSERASLECLQHQHHRLILAFSKPDQYLPDERPLILQQLRERVMGIVPTQDVVAVAPQPSPIKVRQHQADGQVQERMEQPEPMLADLTARLDAALAVEVPTLVLATTQRQAEALRDRIRDDLNQVRRDRALVPIEQAQWIAAAAAFASPVPSLDLLATASVNAQLVMDLGAIYQQSISLEQAKTVANSLADTMIKLGLVELTSQAITPVLKSHALTFAVGGMIQGLSAAYLTRMAGLSLVEYLQMQDLPNDGGFQFKPERLSQILQRVFQANQRTAFLQTLVTQGIQRLRPKADEAIAST